MIKVRGFQVPPPELEAVLLSHPDIVDAAVIGVKVSGVDGEVPRAYVVRRDGNAAAAGLTGAQVRDYMEDRLAKYKSPQGGIKFIDLIPRNASGKILKKDLREIAKTEMREERNAPKL